ncbi:hypothetical protein VPH35_095367 [Triticum aestivum]
MLHTHAPLLGAASKGPDDWAASSLTRYVTIVRDDGDWFLLTQRCWNRPTGSCNRHMLMLEPVSLDAGTGRALGRQHIFCWNQPLFLLEPYAPWAGNTFFAGTSLYFCWNRHFFCYYGHWTLFSVRLFCWNRLIHLLQLAYLFLLLRFLLEPSLSFVGTGKSICFNRVSEVFVAFDICWK